MDIIIPYKQSRSGELEWALESLKNIKHDKVLVLGDDIELPKWGYQSKYHNQIAKLLHACNNEYVSERFAASMDDVFILDEWKPVNYNKGTLQDHIRSRGRNDTYTRSLQYTEAWLKRHGHGTLSFELHTPFVYDKQKLLDLILMIPLRQPMQIRSLYGNYYNIPTEYREDVKNPTEYIGKDIISTDDITFRGKLGKYVREVLSE